METLIIKTDKEKLSKITDFLKNLQVSFTISKKEEVTYNSDFIKMIEQNKIDNKEGKGIKMTIEEMEALWK